MNDIFSFIAYPFHLPEGKELRRLLTESFPTTEQAMDVVQQAGMDRTMLALNKPAYFLWMDILTLAAQSGRLRRLVETASSLLNPEQPAQFFLKALLNDQPVAIPARVPQNNDGSPKFIEGNDIVTKEALLFLDDLTIQIGKLPAFRRSLDLLEQIAPAICHLLVDFNGSTKHGTGFRIGPDQVMTNWHVVHTDSGTPANAITVEFGYEDDGKGGQKNSVRIPCITGNVVSDQADDWAVVTVQQPIDNNLPIIKLSEAVDPVLRESAYIIQHPQGESKRLGFVRNQVADFTDRIVSYLTDTQEGSSGAPVLNSEGKLIALHHAGGRPQQLPGKAPVRKNEGIRISRIKDGLTAKGVAFA